VAMIARVSIPLVSFVLEEYEGAGTYVPGPLVVCCALLCPHAKGVCNVLVFGAR